MRSSKSILSVPYLPHTFVLYTQQIACCPLAVAMTRFHLSCSAASTLAKLVARYLPTNTCSCPTNSISSICFSRAKRWKNRRQRAIHSSAIYLFNLVPLHLFLESADRPRLSGHLCAGRWPTGGRHLIPLAGCDRHTPLPGGCPVHL